MRKLIISTLAVASVLSATSAVPAREARLAYLDTEWIGVAASPNQRVFDVANQELFRDRPESFQQLRRSQMWPVFFRY